MPGNSRSRADAAACSLTSTRAGLSMAAHDEHQAVAALVLLRQVQQDDGNGHQQSSARPGTSGLVRKHLRAMQSPDVGDKVDRCR